MEGYQDLKVRTREFAIRIAKLYSALPKTTLAQTLGKQILRSGTSVGAHYREGMRARSNAEFITKLEGGLQEIEETLYWLEILVGAEVLTEHKVSALMKECDELTAIFTSCVRKTKERNQGKASR